MGQNRFMAEQVAQIDPACVKTSAGGQVERFRLFNLRPVVKLFNLFRELKIVKYSEAPFI